MMSQKLNVWNYGIYWDLLKVHDAECLLAKNQYLIAIWGWDIDNFVFVLNGSEQWQNYKDLYGVTGAWKGQYLIPK